MTTTERIRAGFVLLASCAVLAACGSDGTIEWPEDRAEWQWTDLGGPTGRTPQLVSNHETLVVVGNALLIGTDDGVWRRPLEGIADWERAGLEGRAVHALTQNAGGSRLVAAGYDPADAAAPSVWYSLTAAQSWIPASTWPRVAPGRPNPGKTYPFASLEADPVDANVIYGGLDADTVAVTTDGGATWILANGATEPNFGYPCVSHRPRNAPALIQGCELPLDVAWVGARTVNVNDRYSLTNFRFLFGYPDTTEIGNRRINAIVPVRTRDDRILVGVEGGLLELTSMDGDWSERDAIASRVYYRSDDDSANRPYTYMRAIAPLSADGRHALFGGSVNGTNTSLSLFETFNGGITVRRVPTTMGFNDPRVEQAVVVSENDVLLVISDVEQNIRRSGVYRLRR